MKTYFKLLTLVLCLGVALVSCRDENKNDSMDGTEMENDSIMGTNDMDQNMGGDTDQSMKGNMDQDRDGTLEKAAGQSAADKMDMESDAEVKVKDEKIKMEDSEKEVKIKTEDDGTVEKVKVEYKEEK